MSVVKTKKPKTYAEKIFRKVIKEGQYINGTREIVGFSDTIRPSDSFWEKRSGANCEEVRKMFGEILKGNNEYTWGPFQTAYYTFLKSAILFSSSHFVTDGPSTRRAVITFPEGHCFTSIQVIVRPGTFVDPAHKATVIVNMRSCNAIANFPHDLYLANLVANEVIFHGFGPLHGIKVSEMHINIGSLHHFII